MFVSDFAIRKPLITIVVMLAFVIFGIMALALLQTDEFPEVQPPVVSVTIPYPGASPETVEKEVVDPIEEAISGISGVDRIQSTSLDGFATMIVEFIFEKDVQAATQDIRDAISGVRNDLPAEMEEPVLQRFDPNDIPIVSLALTSDRLDAGALTRIADPGITRQLRGIPGVAEVNVSGGIERQVVVQLMPQAMSAAKVSVNEVVAALQQQNIAAPVGRVEQEFGEEAIRLQGRLESPAEFEQIVVKQADGSAVRLGTVARVLDSTEEARSASMFNGKEAVGIDIIKSTGYSTTEVSDAVLKSVDELREGLPEGVSFDLVRNSGERVRASVRDVQYALLEGAVLTVVVVFLFLNSWRSTVITGMALPVSVLAAFISVWAFGFTLNTMSLLGLSLSIGILIDDAIVVRENIVRHAHLGKSHLQAAHEGTDEIGLAVTATTLSIVVVFIPVATMGGLAQQWFAPFALTIVAAVLVSLFVSFSLDPMLSAYWADPKPPENKRGWVTRMLDRFNNWFESQTDRYARVISWALEHRMIVVLVTILSFAGAMALPALGILGSTFFPETDDSELSVAIETPPGSGLAFTRAKAEQVGRIARSFPEVRYTYSTIGGQTGAVDEGNVFVRLLPKAERDRSEAEVSSALRAEVSRIAAVTPSIMAGGMDAQQKEIQFQLQGPDLDTLNRLASQAVEEVREVPGAVDVGLSTKGRKPELAVEVDRGVASSLGISVGDIAMALRPAFAGIDVGDWIDPTGETRDVYIRLAPEARRNAQDIATLPLTVIQGQTVRTVPLAQVTDIETESGPAQIQHLDRERVIAVQANTLGRPFNEVLQSIQERADALELPAGYSINFGGQAEDQQEVFTRIFVALAVALLLMYFVLVIQFGSFVEPIAIMISLPLSLIGVMLALLITGSTVNLMSLIGVMLLMGVVAKNAILLIDFAKWSEEGGKNREEALVEAGKVRLRPILMTSFALVAGMMPIAIGTGEGADFRAPMGQAIVGGVITSTILTLLVIPTIYDILAGWRDRVYIYVRERMGSQTEPHQSGTRP